MNYELATRLYIDTEAAIAKTEADHKLAVAPLKEKLATLENWLTAKAQEDGLENVKTDVGTVYWSTHHKATVAAREPFFAHCKETEAWDLLEARASKTAVKSYVEAHGCPPPGVDYSSVRVFNFRKAPPREQE